MSVASQTAVQFKVPLGQVCMQSGHNDAVLMSMENMTQPNVFNDQEWHL